MSESKPWRVAVIGGGLSGLVAAFKLRQRFPNAELDVLEAGSRVGGVIETDHDGDYLLEYGADSFSVNPPGTLELCSDLGIADRLIEPLAEHRQAFILRAGKMVPVPEGFALLRPTDMKKVLASKLFSVGGRLRMLAEYFVSAKRDSDDESLKSFAIRRFGQEAFDRLIQPLVAGIYTADASKLSMQATMAQFVELEREHGGMIRASIAMRKAGSDDLARSASGARYGQFRTFPHGMVELFDALVRHIGSDAIRLGTSVQRLTHTSANQWLIGFADSSQATYDAVVVALGAPVASKLLNECCSEAARELRQIPYASSALVLIGVPKDQVDHPLDGFGLVIPECEHREIIAASFSSRKFAGRAAHDHHLIRVFIGGAMQQHLLDRSDQELIELAERELADIVGLRGPIPLTRIGRWNNAMPQYHVGHCDRCKRIDEVISQQPGLELAGNALHGVGIAHCVRTAIAASTRVADWLESTR